MVGCDGPKIKPVTIERRTPMFKRFLKKIPSEVLAIMLLALMLLIAALIGYYYGVCYAIENAEVMVIDENISLLRLNHTNFWAVNGG